MCSLCGTLAGAVHWSEAGAIPNAEVGARRAALRDRLRRIALVNRVLAPLRYRVDEFEETSYILRSPTGAAVLVPDLAGIWAELDRLRGRPLDPLDGQALDAWESAAR